MLTDYPDFSWREKRPYLHSIPLYPFYINTGVTVMPNWNAHGSMYGLIKSDALSYQNLLTKKHKLYPHYSSELIIDAETKKAADNVLAWLYLNEYSYTQYDTGSGKGGSHFHIPRIAEPSELLYAYDQCFVLREFESISDIDFGIYSPMHLLRCPGRTHERTKKTKVAVSTVSGTRFPSVLDINIPSFLLARHESLKKNVKATVDSDWLKLQNFISRHLPSGVKSGSRYTAFWCLAKDLYKCGLTRSAIMELVMLYNNELEFPHDEATIARAVSDAERSVCS